MSHLIPHAAHHNPGSEDATDLTKVNYSGNYGARDASLPAVTSTYSAGTLLHNTVTGRVFRSTGAAWVQVTPGLNGEEFQGPVSVSPAATVLPPTLIALPVTPANGGSIPAGTSSFAIANVDATGTVESVPSPLTTVLFNVSLGTPTAPTGLSLVAGGTLTASTVYGYRVRYVNLAGGFTVAGTAATATPSGGNLSVTMTLPIGPTGTVKRYVERQAGAGTWTQIATIPNNSAGPSSTFTDTGFATGATLSTSDTSAMQTATFPILPIGPTGTSKRILYKSAVGTTAPLLPITTINDNTSVTLAAGNNTAGITQWASADASLGTAANVSAAMGAGAVATENLYSTGYVINAGDRSWLYAPSGWNTGWRKARDNSANRMARVFYMGCSTLSGNGSSDMYYKSIWGRLRDLLVGTGGYALGGEYFPQQFRIGSPGVYLPTSGKTLFSGWLNSLVPAVTTQYGWHAFEYTLTVTSPSNYHQQFTVPYNCVGGIDIVYLDQIPQSGGASTWKYQVGANTAVTVTNTSDGTTGTAGIKKIHIAGTITAGTVIQWGVQTLAAGCGVMGITCYANSPSSGMFHGHWSYSGGQKLTNFSLSGLAPTQQQYPFDRAALLTGLTDPNLTGTPQVSYPYTVGPAALIASGGTTGLAVSGGVVGTGGSLPAATYSYAISFVGNGGETARSAVYTMPGATAASGKNTITIPTDPFAFPNGPTTRMTQARRLYRSINAGSTWQGYYQINENTSTSYVDTGLALTAATAPVAGPTSTNDTLRANLNTFGPPTAPDLLIFEMGADDNVAATPYVANDVTNIGTQLPNIQDIEGTLMRYINQARQVNPDCTVILLIGLTAASTSDLNWTTYYPSAHMPMAVPQTTAGIIRDWLYNLAQQHNCLLIDIGRKWGPNFVNLGYAYNFDTHPTDTGGEDIAQTLFSLLMQ